MPTITVVYGGLLVMLGVAGYLATGRESVTALIPAFFGMPLVALGMAAAAREASRKHAMHGAALLAVLAVAGSARGVPSFVKLLGGGEVDRPAAAIAQAVMFALSLVFVILCVVSFVRARRARARGEGEGEATAGGGDEASRVRRGDGSRSGGGRPRRPPSR